MKYYTGIGSRSTPVDIQVLMTRHAMHLRAQGWTLRSGAAQGADSAFERGAIEPFDGRAPAEIYLPWPGFEERQGPEYIDRPSASALRIAAQHHPNWHNLGPGAQKLHARNVHQVLGLDVDNPVLSRFVICWTKGGLAQGGTGQAIRIAKHYGVPVFDLADENIRRRVEDSLHG